MARSSVITETRLREYLVAISRMPRLDQTDLQDLLDAARAGDGVSWRVLVETCLPWAVSEAAARRGEGRRFDDLLRQANQVLFLALKDFQGPVWGLEPYTRARMRQTLVLTRRPRAL